MKRCVALGLAAADQAPTPAEEAELDAIASSDPGAIREYCELRVIGDRLHALAPPPDVTDAVMAAIWALEAHDVQREFRCANHRDPGTDRHLRVRRSQSQRLRLRRRMRLGIWAVAAAVCLGIGLAWWTFPGEGTEAPEPLAHLVRDGRVLRPVAADETIVARSGESLRLRGEASTFTLEPVTQLRLSRSDGWRLVLETGAMEAEVAAQDRDLLITTPHGGVRVLGTRFAVACTRQATEVRVHEGRVRVAVFGGDAGVVAADGDHARIVDGIARLVRKDGTPAPPRPRVRFDFRLGPEAGLHDQGEYGLSLTLAGSPQWDAQGLRFDGRSLLSTPAASFIHACKATNEVSLVVRIRPETASFGFDVDKLGSARIVGLSKSTSARNLTLGQGEVGAGGHVYAMRVRRGIMPEGRRDPPHLPENGLPAYVHTGVVLEQWVHLAATYSASAGYRLYRDGTLIGEGPAAGGFEAWEDAFPLHIGAEAGGERGWTGRIATMALYDRALSATQVAILVREAR